MFWETEVKKAVNRDSGDFQYQAEGYPIVNEYRWKMIFNTGFVVNGLPMPWIHYFDNPISTWKFETRMCFIEHMLNALDFVHERHCTLEVVQSTAMTNRK